MVLKLKSSGLKVKELQTLLNKHGYNLVVDGKFGKNTDKAVRLFQASMGLTVDGKVGPLTWGELTEGRPSELYPPVEKNKSEVKGKITFDTSLKTPTKGKFALGAPKGLIVHFTAGWSTQGDKNMEDSIRWGNGEGYAFWGIARSGKIYKTHPENEWGSHAGKSYYKGLGSSVSSKLIGVEIANAGRVIKKSSGGWKAESFSESFTDDMVRTVKAKANIKAGTYLKYTPEQEQSLIDLCFYFKEKYPNTFSFDYVLGHDEVAPDRKSDPSGSLSMTMPEFRALLHKLWNEKQNK